MHYGITREEALTLLRENVKNERLVAHCIASEAVMKALARHFGEDEEKWGLAGLLHDLDVELTNADLAVHGKVGAGMLAERGVDPGIVDAIAHHNELSCGEKRSTRFHFALAAGETITGLITATALVYPDRKVASVKSSSVVKRMKEKAFAASVNRETIMECEKIGIPLSEFAAICVSAMAGVGAEIGL
jgi:putative nucleotidyltransferase with HDIG domain